MPLLTASDLNVSYGDVEVFSDVSLEVAEGARIGLVGPNGGGKTSLLRVLVGHVEPSGGHVYGSSSVKIAYVPQVTPASAGGTIRDEVMLVFRETPLAASPSAGTRHCWRGTRPWEATTT